MEVQSTVYYIGIVTLALLVIMWLINRKLVKFNPLDEPKGIVLLVMFGVQFFEDTVRNSTNEEITKKLAPYIMSVTIYIFVANIAGLFGLECPTGNLSTTLALAFITCYLIEHYSIKYNGLKGYVKGLFEPFAPMVVINLISKVSTLASLSLRLFGNILAGSVLMSVIYQMFAFISAKIPVIGAFNVFGVAIAPVLHAYFDLFAGAMQTYIFMTLSVMFIGKELPKPEEN